MSGAIKPPGTGPSNVEPLGPADGAEASEQVEGSQGAAESERTSHTGTAAWLERVDAGEITPEQAVDGIVEDALSAPGVAALAPAERAELESVLRDALREDPTLSALLERG